MIGDMLKRLCLLGLLLGGFHVAGAAPTLEDRQPGLSEWLGGNTHPSLGLIDPSRLSVQHSFSFGFASGGGPNGGSVMQSLYATQFRYQFSNPLTMTFVLGLQNSRFGGGDVTGDYSSVLGGIKLDYRPTSNFFINVEFMRSPVQTWPGMYRQHGQAVPSAE